MPQFTKVAHYLLVAHYKYLIFTKVYYFLGRFPEANKTN